MNMILWNRRLNCSTWLGSYGTVNLTAVHGILSYGTLDLTAVHEYDPKEP